MIQPDPKLVVLESPQQPETALPGDSPGVAQFRQAAELVLLEKCMDIALALLESALQGHVQSARLLLALAGGQPIRNLQVTQKPHSVAIELAAEPQWVGQLENGTAETPSGNREPED